MRKLTIWMPASFICFWVETNGIMALFREGAWRVNSRLRNAKSTFVDSLVGLGRRWES